MRLWGGRFSGETDARTADFTRSLDVDAALALDDIDGSIAHVRGLGRAGLLTAEEVEALLGGLGALRVDVEAGTLSLGSGPGGRPPEPGGRPGRPRRARRRQAPHRPVPQRPGRHRPPPVAPPDDRRTGRRDPRDRARARRPGGAERRRRAARDDAHPARPAGSPRASPARLRGDAGARPRLAWRTAAGGPNVSPLGSGALAGAGYPLDREATAPRSRLRRRHRELARRGHRPRLRGRAPVAAWRSAMVHLSRLAEEITWWSNPRFGFVRAADAFSTGSSMMPNKKNPDPAELVRGRAARVVGALAGFLALAEGPAAGLPARPPGGQAAAVRGMRDATRRRSAVMAGMVGTLEVDRDAMRRRGGRGLHDRHGRRRRAGPARTAVPRRASRRRAGWSPKRNGVRSTSPTLGDGVVVAALSDPRKRLRSTSTVTRPCRQPFARPRRSTRRSPRATSWAAPRRGACPRLSRPRGCVSAAERSRSRSFPARPKSAQRARGPPPRPGHVSRESLRRLGLAWLGGAGCAGRPAHAPGLARVPPPARPGL